MEKQAISGKSAITVNQAKNVNQASNINQAGNINQSNSQDAFVVDEASQVDEYGNKKKNKKERNTDKKDWNFDLNAPDMIEAIIGAMGEGISWGTGKVFQGADAAINGKYGLANGLIKLIEKAEEKALANIDGKGGKEVKADKEQQAGGKIYNPSEKELQNNKDPLKDFKEKTGKVNDALGKAASGKPLGDEDKAIMGGLSEMQAKSSQKESKDNLDAIKRYQDLSNAFGKLSRGEPLEKAEISLVSKYSKDFGEKAKSLSKKVENEVANKKQKPRTLKEAPTKRQELNAKTKENVKGRKTNRVKKKEVKKEIAKNAERRDKLNALSGRGLTKQPKTVIKTTQKDMALIKNKGQQGR